jgi:hypothetical protein
VELAEQKQAFSKAYARAVAAVAGFAVHEPESDYDSIDIGFSAGKELPKRPRLEAQLKCSADDDLRDTDFSFVLSRKNYDDLREDTLVPRILVVVRVPLNLEDWADLTEERLLLRHCGYWHSLRGAPATGNETAVTCRVNRLRTFTPAELAAMMARIQSGGTP